MPTNDWISQLQPASYRGQRFGVKTDEFTVGRRSAVHQYPFRDIPWVEDLGRATRKLTLNGFLVSDSAIYGGGSAMAQALQLVANTETQGPGTLVHPIYGPLQLAGAMVAMVANWENGRVIEFRLTAYEAGQRVFPSAAISTTQAVSTAAATVNSACASDFSTAATPQLVLGSLTAQQALTAVQAWTAQITSLVGGATNLFSLAADLPGNFGRFFNGANVGGLGSVFSTALSAATTVEDLAIDAAAARGSVALAVGVLQSDAGDLGQGASSTSPLQLAADAQTLVALLAGVAADPADSVQNLSTLASFTPVLTPTTIGGALGDLMTRSAIAALAQAVTTYQPSSYNDAATLRANVCALIDAAIEVAGDEGADLTFAALRALRQTVVADLTARGANLARIKTFTVAQSLPSIVLANLIYADPTREPGLVTQLGDIPNPLFCPTSFQALAS